MPKKKKSSLQRATVEERVIKANAAKHVLEDPVIQEAFDNLEEHYNERWVNSDLEDSITRERVFLSLRALSDLKDELTSMINSGDENLIARNG
mgnify:CR=1 FL=1|tara:strand:+ start:264 stop:542 length:279 start_codon:yes stop_codon:yes gene_type:complete